MEHDCGFYETESPQNPAFAWCTRFYLHLDAGGRLCGLCKTDPLFRQRASRQAVVRRGPVCDGQTAECPVFGGVTDPEQCGRCKTDPLFRALLSGQSSARTAAQTGEGGRVPLPCSGRGLALRTEARSCCGGKVNDVVIYACSVRGETHAGLCAVCDLRRTENPD